MNRLIDFYSLSPLFPPFLFLCSSSSIFFFPLFSSSSALFPFPFSFFFFLSFLSCFSSSLSHPLLYSLRLGSHLFYRLPLFLSSLLFSCLLWIPTPPTSRPHLPVSAQFKRSIAAPTETFVTPAATALPAAAAGWLAHEKRNEKKKRNTHPSQWPNKANFA